MSGSFRKIDYSLRPAKHAERRMLAEVARRLRVFAPIEDYRYVGLGSVWFADFKLFHRSLGIDKMTSFEGHAEADELPRFEANKPFNITVAHEMASEGLTTLDWTERQIIWLDYDDPISPSMLTDVRIAATKASSGTLLIVSTNCQRAVEINEANDQEVSPATLFQQKFPQGSIAAEADDADLSGWPFGELSRKMVAEAITKALAPRNLENIDKISAMPVCEIEYADGAKMSTSVILFYSASEQQTAERCSFDRLDFLRPGEQKIRITLPKLTPKELRHLESQLPLKAGEQLDLGQGIPKDEADAFAAVYRYFPNFMVSEA